MYKVYPDISIYKTLVRPSEMSKNPDIYPKQNSIDILRQPFDTLIDTEMDFY